jgi:hypothetical protein
MVSKRDGSVHILGSAFDLDDWLWGYDRGFCRGDSYDLVVTAVRDVRAATAFLEGRLRYPGKNYFPYNKTFHAESLRRRPGHEVSSGANGSTSSGFPCI